jgi:hypothetical protein
MAHYNITAKIGAFSYTHATKPVICEAPKISDDIFLGYKRAIRIVPAEISWKNRDLEQSLRDDEEGYALQIKAASMSDLRNILEDLKEGCANYTPDSTYSLLILGNNSLVAEISDFTSETSLRASLYGVVS